MARKNKALIWINWLVALITGLAIGGFFVAGGFAGVFLLSLLPLIVHQIVGFVIIVRAVWEAIQYFM